MNKVHQDLIENSNWYKKWHQTRLHTPTHLFLFVIISLSFALTLVDAINNSFLDNNRANAGAVIATDRATFPGKSGRPVPTQYIIQFKDDVKDPKGLAEQLTKEYNGKLLYAYTKAIKGFAAKIPDVALNGLKNNPNIKDIEQDMTVQATSVQAPLTGTLWGIDRIDQSSLPVDYSYTYNFTGTGVHVYIVDTGIRVSHNEFGGRASADFSAINDGYGAIGCNRHGTHVAGTVGGSTVGVAKNTKLHSVRVLDCTGNGSDSGVIAGIDWVINNKISPAIINMSLNGSYNSSLNSAVSNAVNNGIIVAVAAGNSGTDACSYSPASALQAITVGASNPVDLMSSFSNYGTCVDVFGPGSGIYSASNTGDSDYENLSGTSMATPHVAGVAALFLEQNPQATPAQVVDAIKTGASKNYLSSLGPNSPNLLVNSLFNGNTYAGKGNSNDTQAPTIPTNLVGNAPDTSHVNLSWSASTDNIGVVGYKIYRNSNLIGNVSGTSYTDSTAYAGNIYPYSISAYDAAGNNSAMSNTINVSVPFTPGVLDISSYSVSSITSTSAVISWTTNMDSVATILYSARNIAGKTISDSSKTLNHTLTLTGLKPGTTYTFSINAVSGSYTDYINGSFKTLRK